jgi:hypothetical protein
MPGRVQVDAERLAWLELSLAGTDRQNLLLTAVEIGHIEVQMQLLRVLVARPNRWFVAGGSLKRDSRACVALEHHPATAVVLDRPSGDGAVKGSETLRITTVDGYEAIACNTFHTATILGAAQPRRRPPKAVLITNTNASRATHRTSRVTRTASAAASSSADGSRAPLRVPDPEQERLTRRRIRPFGDPLPRGTAWLSRFVFGLSLFGVRVQESPLSRQGTGGMQGRFLNCRFGPDKLGRENRRGSDAAYQHGRWRTAHSHKRGSGAR